MKSASPAEASRTVDRTHGYPYLQDQSLAEMFRSDRYPYLVFRIVNGKHVTKAQLRAARMSNQETAAPDLILEYEHRVRRGEVKRPGRPNANIRHRLLLTLVRLDYPGVLRHFQSCRRRAADPWPALMVKNQYDGPPHELAAKVVRDWHLPHCDWKHVLDVAKRKRGVDFI
jgi:hypothetical protein